MSELVCNVWDAAVMGRRIRKLDSVVNEERTRLLNWWESRNQSDRPAKYDKVRQKISAFSTGRSDALPSAADFRSLEQSKRRLLGQKPDGAAVAGLKKQVAALTARQNQLIEAETTLVVSHADLYREHQALVRRFHAFSETLDRIEQRRGEFFAGLTQSGRN